MRQFSYLRPDGSFDYDRYKEVQIAANKAKLSYQWVREPAIAYLAEYIQRRIGHPRFGLCHGTRRGAEQGWFADRLDCYVLGTEISDTADQFPNTIQWDFHEVRPEWRKSVDFIYSNSWDHSYDPVKLFHAWTSCLKPHGLLLLEHTDASNVPNETDPLGLTLEEMVELINDIGKGSFYVDEVLRDGPLTGLPGTDMPARHVVVRRAAAGFLAQPTLAISTIMAGERPYLEEWLAFHRMQGVSAFHIFLDRSRDDLVDDGTEALLQRLAPRYNITIAHWTEFRPSRQVEAFRAGAAALAGRVDWVAFVDADEFLYHPEAMLPQWLSTLDPDIAAVGVQQTVFGSAGRLDHPKEPVTWAYQMRATRGYPEHHWYKSIVRPHRVVEFPNSHRAIVDGRYILGDGGPLDQGEEMGMASRIAESGLRLHHYMLKSQAEWLAKKARGAMSDGAAPGFVRFIDSYRHRDAHCNAVLDDTLAKLRPRIEQEIEAARGEAP